MKQNSNSYILGVTGGIGSGKSTVSSILRELGAEVIDADIISREVVEPGQRALVELTQEFGRDILDDWGRLKRKALADKVFSDEKKLGTLNGIVHKYVAQKIKDNVEEQLYRQAKVIVIDAPIPIKIGFLDLCDQVWTVVAAPETRIERIMKRSGMTREEAVSRIESQISDEEYKGVADVVIYNNEDFSTLKREVECRLARLLR